jgi:hypothetical protein
MEVVLAGLAAVASSGFLVDLVRSYRARPRPHVAAYAAGIGFFSLATWALFFGVSTGWTPASFRAFYLFGAIINVPILALGSMFLVSGRRSGHTMLLLLFPLFAISVPMTLAEPFVGVLPASGVPAGSELFAGGFGPRMWAGVAGGIGTLVLVTLAVVSIVRFRRRDRRIIAANLLIVAGTVAAAGGGTGLALGEASGFAVSLLLAASLIWSGFRVAQSARAEHLAQPGGGGTSSSETSRSAQPALDQA